MTPDEVEDILKRYSNDACNDDERNFVEKSFDAMNQGHSDITPEARQAMQKRLWKKVSQEVHTDHGTRSIYFSAARVAAALLFVFVSLFLIMKMGRDQNPAIEKSSVAMLKFDNTDKEIKKITLKDGSTILLYPGGEVTVPKVFDNTREVHLTGEAFFEVVKDPEHPFIVYTNEVTTKVLGTSFRIKAYHQEKEVTVAVKTGKVSVFTKASGIYSSGSTVLPEQTIVLKPNQQVTYNRKLQKVLVKLVDDPQVVKPQSSLSINYNYTNARVTEILKSLAERYGIDIQYDENRLAGCTITSAFEIQDEGLYEQIEIICNAIGAHYRFSGLSIIIESQSCNK